MSSAAATSIGIENSSGDDGDAPVPPAQLAAASETDAATKGCVEVAGDVAPLPPAQIAAALESTVEDKAAAPEEGFDLVGHDRPPGEDFFAAIDEGRGDGGAKKKLMREGTVGGDADASTSIGTRPPPVPPASADPSPAGGNQTSGHGRGPPARAQDQASPAMTSPPRPPPRSVLPRDSAATAPSVPVFHEVEARLVEDEEEPQIQSAEVSNVPIYDAVQVPAERVPWWKRNQACVVAGMAFVIGAMAAIIGSLLVSRNDADEGGGSGIAVRGGNVALATASPTDPASEASPPTSPVAIPAPSDAPATSTPAFSSVAPSTSPSLTPSDGPPASTIPTFTQGPTVFVAPPKCRVSWDKSCDSRSATSTIAFSLEEGAPGAGVAPAYNASVVFFWGIGSTNDVLGKQAYPANEVVEIVKSNHRATDGQYYIGYSVTFLEGTGQDCEGARFYSSAFCS